MPILRKRSSRVTKKKEKSVSWWIKHCDKAMSQLVRSKGFCEKCGNTENLQHHHIVGRANKTLRYDILNGMSLCWQCHFFQAHGGALAFVDWLDEQFPDRMKYLRSVRNVYTKLHLDDYKRIHEDIINKNFKGLTYRG